jgi:hypothetical protein
MGAPFYSRQLYATGTSNFMQCPLRTSAVSQHRSHRPTEAGAHSRFRPRSCTVELGHSERADTQPKFSQCSEALGFVCRELGVGVGDGRANAGGSPQRKLLKPAPIMQLERSRKTNSNASTTNCIKWDALVSDLQRKFF